MGKLLVSNGEALGYRGPHLSWLAPLAGLLALVTFSDEAGAAGPCLPTATVPCNASPPTIMPSDEVANPPEGRILTATQGTWYGTAPIKYSYQWQRCDAATRTACANIAGATARTYTVTSADIGSRLQIVEKATNSVGSDSAMAQTGVAALGTPINRLAPAMSGPAQIGQTLTASPGSWGGTMPISYVYAWRRCDSTRATCGPRMTAPSTLPTYVVQAPDLGHTLVVYVTATNSVGSASVHSRPTAAVTQAARTPPPPTPGQPGGGPKVSTAKIRARLLHALGVHGRGARIGAVLKHGGYSFSFAAPSRGRLVISWRHQSQQGVKTVVARVVFVFHRSHTAKIKLVLTGKGRRLLNGVKEIKLTARSAFTPAGQVTTSANRRLTLKT